jgi:Na+/Pi-cotransporter
LGNILDFLFDGLLIQRGDALSDQMSVFDDPPGDAQMASTVMLDLMGGVALLLWGLHMVRSGIVRAFGSDLGRVLSTAVRNRFMALLAGLGLTAVLQSSTATGLMTTPFVAAGHVDLCGHAWC